jgi:all-trans-nonaprenyl-diphosphate synthase
MIHTASLVHDDVVDESEMRRGVPTVHSLFGNGVAVLAEIFCLPNLLGTWLI